MVMHTGYCGLCGFTVIKNGDYATRDAIREHSRTEHGEKNREVMTKVRELQSESYELTKRAGELRATLYQVKYGRPGDK